ncbi:MAG: amidohydrolase family protein [Chitinophagaceae bacterium]
MFKLKYILALFSTCMLNLAMAQADVYPAPAYKGLLFLKNATVHVGNGKVLENVTIKVSNGKIEAIAANMPIPMDDVKVFDAAGKHVYPGLILPSSTLGLVEVSSVRASADARELGELNTNIRSIVAYNTDSKVINTLKSNGILFANVVPEGGIISGTSSVVQLDAWHWEDAVVKMDGGVHFRMPSLLNRGGRGGRFRQSAPAADPMERIEGVKQFFREAKAWYQAPQHENTNLKFDAVKGLFEKKQKLFIHCNIVKEMLVAADFKKEFGFDVVIVGGSESFLIADMLKQLDMPVILAQSHALPTMEDDDVDQPYKTAVALQKAGVLYAIGDEDGQTRGRNLPFNAGTAVAYGLSKEEALQAITLNPAKILGVDAATGSIEAGKDASFVVSEGDILDMRSSKITMAFIQGRYLDLTDKHKQLDERYRKKYGLK